MIIADKIFKGNTEILKIFKGLTLEWEKVAPIPGADAYVQDGLVFQLDGIDKGNVEGAWVDRKAGKEFTLKNCIVNSDNIEFNGTNSQAVLYQLLNFGTTTTVEAVYTKETKDCIIIYSGNNVQLMAFDDDGNRKAQFYGNQAIGQTFPDTTIHTLSIPTSGRPILDQIAQPKTHKDFYDGSGATKTVVGGINPTLKGKIYSIRIYNRNLTSAEMMKNQMIDIQRFNIPGYETVNLTIEGNDGKPMTGARFAFLGNQYVYDGTPVTLKVPKGTYYQIDFSCVPDYAACEFLGTYVAEENNVRNLKAIYTYDGWGDYFVSNQNLSGSTAEVRDGITYYKLANVSKVYLDGNVKIYHYPNNENFYLYVDRYSSVSSFETVPHIYTGSEYFEIKNSYSSAKSQTFYNIVHLNSYSYLNGVTYTGTAKRFGSLNSNKPTQLESDTTYENYISPIEVAAGRYEVCYANPNHGLTAHVDTLIIGPHDYDTTFISVCFQIRVPYKLYVKRIPNLLQIYPFTYFDLNNVTFESKEGLIEALLTNSLDRSAFEPCSITLNSNTKASLTSDQIAQITSKGYTIA